MDQAPELPVEVVGGIGLFPDIGTSDVPPRGPGEFAMYLVLSDAPQWRPATLAEVGDAAVEADFQPLGTGELGFDWEPDLKLCYFSRNKDILLK